MVATAEKTWAIENYHRGIKQFCGVEKCQARSATARRNHIAMAFLRLETYFNCVTPKLYSLMLQIL